ncbi:MAG: type II CRISPR-associated endonuclease Cas1 [Firmicutes bacterium]|nr:type II CRISPR-associated endonuclease Cas1 [Bacillota bacterium]
MGFRTLEICHPAEIHVRKGQLEIANNDDCILIPLEDLSTIICSGANIRISTMAQAQIAEAGISLMIIDEKYHPSCMLVPIQSNVRQTLIMRNQILLSQQEKDHLWTQIIIRKIENQSRALTLLGRDGAERILRYTSAVTSSEIDALEANAAKDYFQYLHPGLNRRNDDPVNSCLNYGYAVLRNAIIRAAILAGFQPALGLHHDNYLNAFNLADDLIEPWRPMVDVIALRAPGASTVLNRAKRVELAMVLHHACLIDNTKMPVLSGIEEMVGSLRNFVVSCGTGKLKLPIITSVEIMDAIKE